MLKRMLRMVRSNSRKNLLLLVLTRRLIAALEEGLEVDMETGTPLLAIRKIILNSAKTVDRFPCRQSSQ